MQSSQTQGFPLPGAARTAPNLAVHGVRSEHEALPFVCSESSDGSHIDMRGGPAEGGELSGCQPGGGVNKAGRADLWFV